MHAARHSSCKALPTRKNGQRCDLFLRALSPRAGRVTGSGRGAALMAVAGRMYSGREERGRERYNSGVTGHIEAILDALNSADVRYLVVGGVAVVLHGHLRTTLDLDLVIQLEQGNLDRAIAVLSRLGYQPRAPVPFSQLADPDVRRSWITEKNMMVFSLWHPTQTAFEVDIFVEEPFDFDDTYQRRVDVALEQASVPVIGLADLIDLKQRADRPRDQEDVAALRALSEER